MRGIGIDIGSTSAKAAVLDGDELLATYVIPTGYSGKEAALKLQQILLDDGYDADVLPVVATGYGRVAVPFALQTVTEISCHAKGAAYLFGEDGLIVDVGGQDTKVIQLKAGKVIKFQMNDKCSAGTGKFLEVMANRLGITQDELADLARQGCTTTISSMCTVFAESEVIGLIGAGEPRENIAFGIIESVAQRVSSQVGRTKFDAIWLTGGLCENDYFMERLGVSTGLRVVSDPRARFAGAIGAACLACAGD